MNKSSAIFAISILLAGLSGCDNKPPQDEPSAIAVGNVTKFDGTWEVKGRTGTEDGSNEPVCGSETGLGVVTISSGVVKGTIKNSSDFEYTFNGKIDASGKLTGMMLYSGYDAAKIFGHFTETSGKGTWEDALNACPGVWVAARKSAESDSPEKISVPEKPVEKENPINESGPDAKTAKTPSLDEKPVEPVKG